MCQRKTLQKLIRYATQVPSDEDNHEVAHKYPFVAADILSSSKTITQALVEGGWELRAEEEEEDTKESTFEDSNENKMVQSILKNTSVSEPLNINARFSNLMKQKKLLLKNLMVILTPNRILASRLLT
jgi:hypothetical protein